MTDEKQREARGLLRKYGLVPHEIPNHPCPFCGYVLRNIALPIRKTLQAPDPASVCICTGCVTPLVFEAGWVRRAMLHAEYQALTGQERLRLEELRRLHRLVPDYGGHDGPWPPAGDT